MAKKMDTKVEVQAAAYEGYTVWFNSLIQSAGGTILSAPDKASLEQGPLQQGARRSSPRWRKSSVGRPVDRQLQGGLRAPGVREGRRVLPGQLPVHLSERRGDQGLPGEDRLGAVPAGGRQHAGQGADRRLQLRRRRLHQAPEGGLRRRRLPAQRAQPAHRRRAKGGLPPTLATLYDDAEFKKAYPFADLIKESIDERRAAAGAPRCTPTCRWRSPPRCRRPNSFDAEAPRPTAASSRSPRTRSTGRA